jgi:hypothetical protein
VAPHAAASVSPAVAPAAQFSVRAAVRQRWHDACSPHVTRVGMRWHGHRSPERVVRLPKSLAQWLCARRLVPQHGGHSNAPQNIPQDAGEHGQPGGVWCVPRTRDFAGCGGQDIAVRAASQPRQFRSHLGHAIRRAQRVGDGLGHALRCRRQAAAAAADGGGRRGLERRPDLDLQAAARSQVPRWRARAGQGCGGQSHPLDRPRLHGPDDQGPAEGADGRR